MSQKKELQEAMRGTDVTALYKALDQATEVGVEQELIEAGQQRCEDMLCDMFLAAFDKVGVISEIPYGPIPRPAWHGDKCEVSFDHLFEFHEVWLSIDPKGTFTVQRHNLQAILQRLNRPLGIAGLEPPFTDAQLRQYIGELDLPDHDGQIQCLETLPRCGWKPWARASHS